MIFFFRPPTPAAKEEGCVTEEENARLEEEGKILFNIFQDAMTLEEEEGFPPWPEEEERELTHEKKLRNIETPKVR